MSTTAQQVFEITMDFADEREENSTLDPTNTASYLVRTPGILTALQAELIGYDGTPNIISSMTDTLQVNDVVARTLLPYGLGAEIFKEENSEITKHFRDRYKELRRLRKRPAVEEHITDVYSPTEE